MAHRCVPPWLKRASPFAVVILVVHRLVYGNTYNKLTLILDVIYVAVGISGVVSVAGGLAVVVTAALPTAQNVFVAANRYEEGVLVAKDTVLLTTLVSLPVLVAIAALLT